MITITRFETYYSNIIILGANHDVVWGTVLMETRTTIEKDRLFRKPEIITTSNYERIRILRGAHLIYFRNAETGLFVKVS